MKGIEVMDMKTFGALALAVTYALFIIFISACGSSDEDGLALVDIPPYPKATKGKTMAKSIFGGVVGGSLEQFSTTDSYEEVVDFYTEALTDYDTEVISNKSELGRQTALSIPQKNGMVSVAIQEFTKEGKVNITLMKVES
jgi:hypothetical protein